MLVRRLEAGECNKILAEWRTDPVEPALRRHRICLDWTEWGDVFQLDSGEMFSVDVAKVSVGMMEYHFDAELQDLTPAVGLLRLARRPSTFLNSRIKGVARCLVKAMVRRSFETGHLGQVLIKEALGPSREDPALDARRVYEALGFQTVGQNPGENSFHMELYTQEAYALLSRHWA